MSSIRSAKIGGWFRLGNRPNEGQAEMTTCLYLPDGRVAFMYGRPKIADNKAMNAGGMKIEVVEPFKKLKVTYDGKACVLARPFDMAEPSKAFRENPTLDCKVELDYEGVSPMYGGETVREDGKPIADRPGEILRQGALRAAHGGEGYASPSATRSSTSTASACATRAGDRAIGRRSTGIAGAR